MFKEIELKELVSVNGGDMIGLEVAIVGLISKVNPVAGVGVAVLDVAYRAMEMVPRPATTVTRGGVKYDVPAYVPPKK